MTGTSSHFNPLVLTWLETPETGLLVIRPILHVSIMAECLDEVLLFKDGNFLFIIWYCVFQKYILKLNCDLVNKVFYKILLTNTLSRCCFVFNGMN